ncbi:hypothetical protein NBRC10513_008163, partial [Rhodotorula toruloides]
QTKEASSPRITGDPPLRVCIVANIRILRSGSDSPEPIDLYADVGGPRTHIEALEDVDDEDRDEMIGTAMETLIARVQAPTDEEREMAERNTRVMADFAAVFGLPALTKNYLERTMTRRRIKLVDTARTHNQRGSNLVDFAPRPRLSPLPPSSFRRRISNAKPRWVNDYCALNSNTVKDRTPLPVPDVVLADAAPARDWGKIDLRNAFFQTPMHPETCRRRQSGRLGVSSVDGHAAGPLQRPATHQARVNEALRHLIRVCCQVFVDDVIIYPSLLEEHERNVRLVLEATRKAGLYCSRKKTELSTLQAEFLGHILPHEGIEADPSKIGKVRNWSRPANSPGSTRLPRTRPIPRKFSPSPAHHTAVLTPLMWKGFVDVCGSWGEREEKAFETIKRIVTSLPVLCPVDQESD